MKSDGLIKSLAATTTSSDPPMQRKTGRKTLETRLQEIIEQQARLQEQKRALAAAQRAAARARELEIESIIGAICRGDKTTHEIVKAALAKNVRDAKQQALLRTEGWI
jgi:hypothetical protein